MSVIPLDIPWYNNPQQLQVLAKAQRDKRRCDRLSSFCLIVYTGHQVVKRSDLRHTPHFARCKPNPDQIICVARSSFSRSCHPHPNGKSLFLRLTSLQVIFNPMTPGPAPSHCPYRSIIWVPLLNLDRINSENHGCTLHPMYHQSIGETGDAGDRSLRE